jgi:hypothetical protein
MIGAAILLSRLQVPPGRFWREGGLLSVLTGGDAVAYLSKAQAAPWLTIGAGDTTSAFFPVFPFLLKLGSLVSTDLALAGVVIANLSLLAAGLLLHRFMRLEYDDPRVSRFAVMLLMFSPAGYFFSCAVPDSTALLLAIAAMLAAATRRWLVACLCGLMLCGTVSAGFCIVVPLFVEYLRQTPKAGVAGLLRPASLVLILILVPLAAALVVGYTRFNNPFALLELSANSEKALDSLLRLSTYFKGYAAFYKWLFRASLVAAVMLCIAGYMLKVRMSLLSFVIAIVALCLFSYDLQAARTLGLAFPLFVIMGVLSARVDWLYDAFVACSMVLLALCTIAAANGFWIS